MCGIVACYGELRESDLDRLLRARERMRHRGPDDAGATVEGRAALGHRRLSIIDLARGRQPLRAHGRGRALVCNGEIYNHRALRRELEARYGFETRSDSEVILPLADAEDGDWIERLDGMFAFVLTDGRGLLAARDPLGIKPLYLGEDGGGRLWFASEIKALSGVCERIHEFPAGHRYTGSGGFERWYRPAWTSPPRAPGAGDGAVAPTLERAVVKRLGADVPLGVFLSGGLDSSLIAALARPHVDSLESFSVGLDGAPDLEAARQVARALGTRHRELRYTERDLAGALEEVIFHLESYDASLIRSALPCFFVSRLAAEHVKVVLTGEGADEAFAGYRYFSNVSDPGTLHRESVRLLGDLHHMNLQRVDRMTMAHGLEARVPFLDTAFLDVAMAIDPREKLHRRGRPEKWLLRRAFEGRLPHAILWRGKAEFAQGCGSEASLLGHAETAVSDGDLSRAAMLFPYDPPATKEELLYRRIFEGLFPDGSARETVGRWRGAFPPQQEEAFDA